MAKALGMARVFVHKHGGILSAYGLCLADAAREEQEPAAEAYGGGLSAQGRARLGELAARATRNLVGQGYAAGAVRVERYVNMRYQVRGRAMGAAPGVRMADARSRAAGIP